MPELHFKVLPQTQLALWKKLQADIPAVKDLKYYLAGGTALALQIGHRQSLDFDFFSNVPNTAERTHQWLHKIFAPRVRDRDSHTLHVDLNGVKVSFIGNYRYPMIQNPIRIGNMYLASIFEIALMKLLSITHRAVLRDYIDLAAILRGHIPLVKLLRRLPQKYGKKFNTLLTLKALVSFQDLDQEMPPLLDKKLANDWKKILTQTVRQAAV